MTRLPASLAAILTAVCACLWSAALAAPEPIVRAPYRLDYGGWYTVSVTINGEGPYDFIIDTGATHTLVFENLATVKQFPPSGGPPQLVLGVSSAASLPTYVVGDIAFGAAVLENAWCVVLPDWTVRERSPHGVLGLDLLAQYRVVFDAENRQVLLYDRSASIRDVVGNWRGVDLVADNFDRQFGVLYTVEGVLDRKRARFLVDLGAAGTIINFAASSKSSRANQMYIDLNPLGGATRLNEIRDANDEAVTALAVTVDRFRIGRTVWMKRVFVAHDAQIFRELGVEKAPFGLLGTDLLRDRSFALDFPGGRMLIGPRS